MKETWKTKTQDRLTPSNIITLAAMASSKSKLGEILDRESKMIINKFRDTIAKRNTEGDRWNERRIQQEERNIEEKTTWNAGCKYHSK